MTSRKGDGSAGDTDYGAIGVGYSKYRRPDPRIASAINAALGSAQTILNVGAGAGSYEPADKNVIAVEPSASMRAQRSSHLATAVNAVAENLPFSDDQFESSMATFTIHQWSDLDKGLAEMRRVTRGSVVILTCDPLQVETFWLSEYAPQVLATEAQRYPSIDRISRSLGGVCHVQHVPIPLDCVDGFNEAYYGRPELLLDGSARLVCSAWSFVELSAIRAFERDLRADLDCGAWDRKYGDLRTQPTYPGSLRLVISRP